MTDNDCPHTECEYHDATGCGYKAQTGLDRPCAAGDKCDFSGAAVGGGKCLPNSHDGRRNNGRKASWPVEKAPKLVAAGKTDAEIAEILGAPNEKAVKNWRHRRGIASQRKKKEGTAVDETRKKTVAEIHADICDSIKDLYARKNHDYGNSFGRARKVVPCYTLGKLYDKFSRYQTLTTGAQAQVDETTDDTLLDLANYCIMELAERQAEREEK